MRLLHISDLHLGKKLEGKVRLDEQSQVLDEIVDICDKNKVDVVLLAGDIFDTYTPSADAEELFFDKVVELARNRYVVAISGNHDDSTRLCASSTLAQKYNIILIGDMDNSRYNKGNVQGGNGFVRIRINDQVLNLGALPFPNETRMQEMIEQNTTFTQKVEEWICECCSCFSPNEINVFMSHLFIIGSDKEGDERELGTAKLLPKSILPKDACYVALGHIHKPQTVIKDKAYYSGSILQYSFDDVYNKRVILVDSDGVNTDITSIPLTKGRQLLTIPVVNFDQAIKALDDNPDKLVQLKYLQMSPLSSRESALIRKKENFVKIIITPKEEEKITHTTTHKSESELFSEFYFSKYHEQPSSELVDLFLEVVNK